jgi:Family of unknown function (DUF5681)
MGGSLATNLSPAIPKVKKRPRGKPFAKGNTLSLPYRFKPGQSGNPGGRPKSKEINSASRDFLGSDTGKAPRIQTNAEAIVAKLGRRAKKGDLGAATFLADRAEGRPAVSITTNDGGKGVVDIFVAHLKATAEERGRPEGWTPPLLEGASNDDDQSSA